VGDDRRAQSTGFKVEDAEGGPKHREDGERVPGDDRGVGGGEDDRGDQHAEPSATDDLDEGGLEEVSIDDLFDDGGGEDGPEHHDTDPRVVGGLDDALEGLVGDRVGGLALDEAHEVRGGLGEDGDDGVRQKQAQEPEPEIAGLEVCREGTGGEREHREGGGDSKPVLTQDDDASTGVGLGGDDAGPGEGVRRGDTGPDPADEVHQGGPDEEGGPVVNGGGWGQSA
jgi:hypothetical protein